MQAEVSTIIFEVIDSSAPACYAAGDRIVVTEMMLSPPANKGLCKLLIPRLVDIIEKEELHNPDNQGEFSFSCKGDNKSCMGVLCLRVRENLLGDKTAVKNIEQIIKLINKVAFFKDFSPAQLRKIFPLLSYKKIAAGTTVINKGDIFQKVFMIISGEVEVFDGDNRIARLGPGEIFGEMSLLRRKKAVASVVVSKPSWVIEIEDKNFQTLLRQYPSIQMYLVRLLSKRLARTTIERSLDFNATCMSGKLPHLSPAELLQMLHSSQQTGTLRLDLSHGPAQMVFRHGEFLAAAYNEFVDKEALFAILAETEGRFKFVPDQVEVTDDTKPLGNFMALLLEGLHRLDEGRGAQP